MRLHSLKRSLSVAERKKLLYRAVSYIPKGKVSTYARIGEVAGITNPRAVGTFLHQNPDPLAIPCHRIVAASGAVATAYAFGGAGIQKQKLAEEGVLLKGNRVDIKHCLWKPSKALKLFFDLVNRFGNPGPWPWFGRGTPHSAEEIIIGAILTQNTNWKNAERAIKNLRQANAATLKKIYTLGRKNMPALKQLIRPTGFFNQKAKCLYTVSQTIVQQYGGIAEFFPQPLPQARARLLAITGIGKETADTMLLYAGSLPIFVVDAYTKRFVKAHRLTARTTYDAIQRLFMRTLPKDVKLCQDYHALIVRWGKEIPK